MVDTNENTLNFYHFNRCIPFKINVFSGVRRIKRKEKDAS